MSFAYFYCIYRMQFVVFLLICGRERMSVRKKLILDNRVVLVTCVATIFSHFVAWLFTFFTVFQYTEILISSFYRNVLAILPALLSNINFRISQSIFSVYLVEILKELHRMISLGKFLSGYFIATINVSFFKKLLFLCIYRNAMNFIY